MSCPALPPTADAAEVLSVRSGDGKSFYSYSTRLGIKQAYYLLNINGGTRPYAFSLTKPFVVVEPSYPGTRVSFKVIPKAVGTTILTVKDTKGNTMVREIVVYDPGAQPLALSALPDAGNPVAVGQRRGFGVPGGKPPYTVTASNPSAVTIQQQSAGQYAVTGRQAGVVGIVAKDSAGTTRELSLIVRNLTTLTLAAPSALTVGPTGTAAIRVLSGQGGVAPYRATVSGNQLQVNATQFQMAPRAKGTATITVRDSKGTTATQVITVQ